MKSLDLFRSLKSDADLAYTADYHGKDEKCTEARRAQLMRCMVFDRINHLIGGYLREPLDTSRVVAHRIMNEAIVHYVLLSRWAAMEKAGAVKAGAFKAAEKHIQAVASAEKALAAIDSGADFWPAARIFAEVHFQDAAWFDKHDSLVVMRPTETRVPLR